MFEINKNRIFRTDLPIITHNRVNILEDDLPILYYGNNRYGNIILGSIVSEDIKNKLVRYYHVIIDINTFYNYLNKKLTYRNILEQADTIFILDENYSANIITTYNYSLDLIPVEYLPQEDTYCPNYDLPFGLRFILSLKGLRADLHEALPDVINQLQSEFINFLEDPFRILKKMGIEHTVYQEAYTPGSFQINFHLDIKSPDLFFKEDLVIQTINKFFSYCLNYLPQEADSILDDNISELLNYHTLLTHFDNIYVNFNRKKPDDFNNIMKLMINDAAEQLNEMSDCIGIDFENLEIKNKFNELQLPIGIIDKNYKAIVDEVAEKFEKKLFDTQIDDELKQYDIHIYQLNTETRKGKAYIEIKDSEFRTKVNIKINGDDPINNTKFTESLHRNKLIKVDAIAKKVNNSYKSLIIEYENNII